LAKAWQKIGKRLAKALAEKKQKKRKREYYW